jgi:putative ATP-dependent endonuclease of OLD family
MVKMALKKIKIENFKIFEGFELEFNSGLNILVGDNEVGKSTILEAVHLALTGMINGKYLNTELTQYLFNNTAVERYLASLKSESPNAPPIIKIELYFNACGEISEWMGGINSDRDKDAYGLSLEISLNDPSGEYAELIKSGAVETLPIEYYDAKWTTFAEKTLTVKSIPLKSAMVDSSLARYQNGSDVYISRIVRQGLENADKISIAQAHRRMSEGFAADEAIQTINQKIRANATMSDKEISLSVELLSKNAWENSLMTYIDKVPFHYIGKGEQCVVKTRLALADKKAKNASVILLEEPENHLTHTRLNQLLDVIASECEGRQVIITTHSSFVANKLGLDNIILLGEGSNQTRFSDLLGIGTPDFFKKLPGYDTLRLVLSKSTILVEGASDELIVQKAYAKTNKGKLPISDGTDVISVGTSFLRFLEIAARLDKRIAVVTDNDGKIDALENKYKDYLGDKSRDSILISYDKRNHIPSDNIISGYNYNTLENLMLSENGLDSMNAVLGKKHKTEDNLRIYMKDNKTDCALQVFEYSGNLNFPAYIQEAINHVSQ